MIPGSDGKVDSEYVRNGTVSIFAFVEPLGAVHHVSVREHRTAIDRAEEIRYLVDVMYPDAEKIILVIDNLNTHKPASLYKQYPPEELQQNEKRILESLRIAPPSTKSEHLRNWGTENKDRAEENNTAWLPL